MYKDKNYNTKELKLYQRRLCLDHSIRITTYLMDRDMVIEADWSEKFLDGQVDITSGADLATRKLTASFVDVEKELGIGSNGTSADSGLLFSDKMIQVWYGVYVPELTQRIEADKWVDVPVFTGPITSYQRTGSVLSIEASSKEILAGTVWKTHIVRQGTDKICAIKEILQAGGEDFFGDLGRTNSKLKNEIVLATTPIQKSDKNPKNTEPSVYWSEAERVAQSMGKILYIDGAGYVQLKNKPINGNSPIYTFNDGLVFSPEPGEVLSEPQISMNSEIINIVRVDGKVPEANGLEIPTQAPSHTEQLPRGHPLSPYNLGREVNDKIVPAYYPEFLQDDKYVTTAACEKAAKAALTDHVSASISVSFECLPIPHLDVNDWCRIKTSVPNITTDFSLKTATLPLNSKSPMTVGYTKISSYVPVKFKGIKKPIVKI